MRINGNLEFFNLGDGEIRNAIIERVAGGVGGGSLPATNVAARIACNTDDDLYYYHNGTAWVPFSTGGDTAALQAEVDAIETSSGGIFNSSGVWTNAPLATGTTSGIDSATDLAAALLALDAAIQGSNNLGELVDVTDGQGYAANVYGLLGDGSSSYSLSTISLGNLSNVADGVDSANTDDILAFDGTEWTAITAATFGADITLNDIGDVTVTSVAAGEVLTWTGAAWENQTLAEAGVQPADAGLDALAAAGTGMVSMDGDTVAFRTISTDATNGLTVTNGDGVAGNPTVSIDAGLESIAGLTTAADDMIYATAADTYATTTVTSYARSLLDDASEADARTTLGLVAGGAGDIWVEKAGDAMTGFLTLSGDPTNANHAATKAYVDATAAGLSWKNSVRAASTGNTALTGGDTTLDGVTLADGDRVLLLNQTDPAENGVYVFATGGNYTRATDFDSLTPIDEINGAAVYVEEGSTLSDAGYTVTSQVATLGTDPITFTQFNGAASITAGVGLSKSGNTINANVGAGIAELPSDEIGIDLYAANALILTQDGTTSSTDTAAALHLLLDGSTLTQSASGLKLADLTDGQILVGNGSNVATGVALSGDVTITNAGVASLSADSVDEAEFAGGKTGGNLLLVNSAGDPIYQAMSGDIAITDAGVTTIQPGAVDNSMLSSDHITMAGDTGSNDVNLDDTFTFVGGTLTTTTVAGDQVTIDVAAASGDLTDVVLTSAAQGEILVRNGSNQFVNEKVMHVETVGAAATTWTVTHNLGQQFVNVTVYDATNEVIIPESITATSATVTTITFNTAITGTAVVMGIPGA